MFEKLIDNIRYDFLLILSIIILNSCKNEDYKYKIVGKVNTKDGKKDAVWYVDTIFFNSDTIFYVNSDSSKVEIAPPYMVYEIK